MSVIGEFRRSIASYLEHLGTQGSAEARHREARLRDAQSRADRDLAGAAEAVLRELDGGARPKAAQPERILSEHLVAICRVVVGR